MNDKEKIGIRELALRKRVEALFGSGVTDPKYIDMILGNMKDVSMASMKLVTMNTGVYLTNLNENIDKFRSWIISVSEVYKNEKEWKMGMKITGDKNQKKSVCNSIEALAKSLNNDTDVSTIEKLSIKLISDIIIACDGNIFDKKYTGMKIEEEFKQIATTPYSINRK